MSNNIIHEGNAGNVVTWTNGGTAVLAGAIVVLTNCIGIALVDIANGASGAVAIEGVVSGMPKVTGNAWEQGEKLNWDVSAAAFDYSGATPATGDITGGAIAWAAAASADTTGTIKLTPGNSTIT